MRHLYAYILFPARLPPAHERHKSLATGIRMRDLHQELQLSACGKSTYGCTWALATPDPLRDMRAEIPYRESS
ncbi:hypothetical protein EMPG_16245 [Blastomyces silverae]|uniref:Uncharacterized protein n=1 Tax=Blastomyces silverae TaxID=2060906 RepID=A0A0H1BA83_9EURO|nr:hypothetical protein EMPG_16245 [Blastomyces silverae]